MHHFSLEGVAGDLLWSVFVILGFGSVPFAISRAKVRQARDYERAVQDIHQAEPVEARGVSGQSGAVIPNVTRR